MGIFEEKEEDKSKIEQQEKVIRFDIKHDLGFGIYNASDFDFNYGSFRALLYSREDNDGERDLAPPRRTGHLAKPTAGSFRVFEDKVKLSWRDYNDNLIEYEFNFEDIFKDKIIPHNKEDEDLILLTDPFHLIPGIVIEVDDRTLNIYSDIILNIKIPGTNKLRHRRDRILVFSKTF